MNTGGLADKLYVEERAPLALRRVSGVDGHMRQFESTAPLALERFSLFL